MTSDTEPAIYQPLLQEPDASEDVGDEESTGIRRAVESVPLDSRVRWIHFIIGCAVLLQWNGKSKALLSIIQ